MARAVAKADRNFIVFLQHSTVKSAASSRGLNSNVTGLLGKDRAPCSTLLFKEASDHAQQLHRAVGFRDIDCAG
jgi:hypothetical protein